MNCRMTTIKNISKTAVKAEGDFLLSGLSQEKIMEDYLAMRESN
jgi:hypothetical protein